ncbi:MAG: hypothetical protein ABSB35_33750, partial [Bryobacteraceae bacterium]
MPLRTVLFSIFTLGLAQVASWAQSQAAVAALPQAWVLPPVAQPEQPQTVAVRAGRLFDPKSGTLLANQIVL